MKSTWLPKDFLKCQTLAPRPTEEPRTETNPPQNRTSLKKLGKAQKTKPGDWGPRLNLSFFTTEFFYHTINALILASECYLKLGSLKTSMSIIKSAEKLLPLITPTLNPSLLTLSTKTHAHLAKIYLKFSQKFQTSTHTSTSLAYYNKALHSLLTHHSLLTFHSLPRPKPDTNHGLAENLKLLIVICLNILICYQQSEDGQKLIETIKLVKWL